MDDLFHSPIISAEPTHTDEREQLVANIKKSIFKKLQKHQEEWMKAAEKKLKKFDRKQAKRLKKHFPKPHSNGSVIISPATSNIVPARNSATKSWGQVLLAAAPNLLHMAFMLFQKCFIKKHTQPLYLPSTTGRDTNAWHRIHR